MIRWFQAWREHFHVPFEHSCTIHDVLCELLYAMLLLTVIVPTPLVNLRNRLPPIYRMHRHAGEKTPDRKRAFSIDGNHESTIKSLSLPIMFIVVYQHQLLSIVQHYQPLID